MSTKKYNFQLLLVISNLPFCLSNGRDINYKPVSPYVWDSIQSSKLTSLACKWVGHNDFPKLYPFQPIWPNLEKLYQDYAKTHHYNPDHRQQSKQY